MMTQLAGKILPLSIESGAKPTRHPLGSFLAGGIISALHIRDMHRLANHLPASYRMPHLTLLHFL